MESDLQRVEAMRLGLLGYGKMGKLIEQISSAEGHTVVAKHSSQTLWDKSSFEDADVWIDFSHGQAVLSHCEKAVDLGKPLVIGTTGWESELEAVKTLVGNRCGVLYAPNCSLGVHLFLQIVKEAASLVAPFNEYDVAGTEMHHRQKGDSPSGTARLIAESLVERLPQKQRAVYQTSGEVSPEELHFSSTRCGRVTGEHSVFFDSEIDTITLTHHSKGREAYARGALTAAEWIRERKGFFTLEDMLC